LHREADLIGVSDSLTGYKKIFDVLSLIDGSGVVVECLVLPTFWNASLAASDRPVLGSVSPFLRLYFNLSALCWADDVSRFHPVILAKIWQKGKSKKTKATR